MKARYLIFLAAAAGLSCGHHSQSTAVRRTPPLPPPQPVFERHVRNAIDAGDGDYRIKAARERMAADPENLAVRLELAALYAETGYPEIALEHCRLAAARFPESADAALALAKTLRKMDLRLEAARGLDVFLTSHKPAVANMYSWLGIIRDELGQYTEGEKAHREAVRLEPNSAFLRNNLGYNFLLQDRREAAAAEFRAALALDPAYTLARNNLGVALATEADKALAEWREANGPAAAHNNLGAVLIEQGRYAEARKELEIALGYNRLHPAALKNLRLVSELDGRPASMPAGQVETRWNRWKSAVRSLFVGPVPGDSPRKGPVQTAKGSL
ncbi:MAG: hypothetical protein ACE15B_08005 [Bryobacteraceae bacterium]